MNRLIVPALSLVLLGGVTAQAAPPNNNEQFAQNQDWQNRQQQQDQHGDHRTGGNQGQAGPEHNQMGYGQGGGHDMGGRDWNRYDQNHQFDRPHWNRGDRYRGHYEPVDDWRGHHLRRPPHGYRWVQTDDGDFILMAVTTGVILDLLLNQEPDRHR